MVSKRVIHLALHHKNPLVRKKNLKRLHREKHKILNRNWVVMPRIELFTENEYTINHKLADRNFKVMTLNSDGCVIEVISSEEISYDEKNKKLSIPNKYCGQKVLKYNVKVKGVELTMSNFSEEYSAVYWK